MHSVTLAQAAKKWPTPKASASGPDFARMNREGSGGDDLATAVEKERRDSASSAPTNSTEPSSEETLLNTETSAPPAKPRIPTPTAGDARSSGSRNTPGSKAHAGTSLTDFVKKDGGKGRTGPHKAEFPTPSATPYGSSGNGTGNNVASRGRPSLDTMAKTGAWPTEKPQEQEMFPTPRTEDGQCAGGHRGKDDTLYGKICKPKLDLSYQKPLPGEVAKDKKTGEWKSTNAYWARVAAYEKANGITPDMLSEGQRWPTPTASDSKSGYSKEGFEKASRARKKPLRDVARWATPSAADAVGSHGGGQGRSLRTDMHEYREETGTVGQLNPDWVELLMGWEPGWTMLDELAEKWFEETVKNERSSKRASTRGAKAGKKASPASRKKSRTASTGSASPATASSGSARTRSSKKSPKSS